MDEDGCPELTKYGLYKTHKKARGWRLRSRGGRLSSIVPTFSSVIVLAWKGVSSPPCLYRPTPVIARVPTRQVCEYAPQRCPSGGARCPPIPRIDLEDHLKVCSTASVNRSFCPFPPCWSANQKDAVGAYTEYSTTAGLFCQLRLPLSLSLPLRRRNAGSTRGEGQLAGPRAGLLMPTSTGLRSGKYNPLGLQEG